MPNWCSNTLWIKGNPEQLKEFISKSVKPNETNPKFEDFTLEGLYPTPPELLDTTAPSMPPVDADETAKAEYESRVKMLEEKYGYSDWYSWRVNEWGTKWDVCEVYIHQEDDCNFMVTFDSAWAPPLTWLEYITPQFPDLNFRLAYSEAGVGFCGLAYTNEDGDLEFEEGDLVYVDEDGKEVEFDSEADKWKYIETGEIIEDEDFYPFDENPYLY